MRTRATQPPTDPPDRGEADHARHPAPLVGQENAVDLGRHEPVEHVLKLADLRHRRIGGVGLWWMEDTQTHTQAGVVRGRALIPAVLVCAYPASRLPHEVDVLQLRERKTERERDA